MSDIKIVPDTWTGKFLAGIILIACWNLFTFLVPADLLSNTTLAFIEEIISPIISVIALMYVFFGIIQGIKNRFFPNIDTRINSQLPIFKRYFRGWNLLINFSVAFLPATISTVLLLEMGFHSTLASFMPIVAFTFCVGVIRERMQNKKNRTEIENKKSKDRLDNFTFLLIIIGFVLFGFLFLSIFSSEEPKEENNLAQCISDSGAKFYGTFWCPECNKQKELFGQLAPDLPYVECSTHDGVAQTLECQNKNISDYPTWEFKNDEQLRGVLQPETLARITGCNI